MDVVPAWGVLRARSVSRRYDVDDETTNKAANGAPLPTETTTDKSTGL